MLGNFIFRLNPFCDGSIAMHLLGYCCTFEFHQPIELTGYYGIKKQVQLLTLSVDEAEEFLKIGKENPQ